MQQRFQERPVTKNVFPLVEEFRYNALGVPPKTIHVMSDLGRIIYLDSETKLNQFDIASQNQLRSIPMGTRPPLKHYPIIDLVCDQTSRRIYTLSKNWMLEIWDIEQDASLPIK